MQLNRCRPIFFKKINGLELKQNVNQIEIPM